jgi:hypothetical protein
VNDVVDILRSNHISVAKMETIAQEMGDKEVSVVFTSPLPIDSLIFNMIYSK